jgi:hypothetical protein
MADREMIAATLTAGMLPPLPAQGGADATDRERADFSQAVAHAVSLYRAVLEAISIRPGNP